MREAYLGYAIPPSDFCAPQGYTRCARPLLGVNARGHEEEMDHGPAQ